MDKEILSNLEQFLPEEVLEEIFRANGWKRNGKGRNDRSVERYGDSESIDGESPSSTSEQGKNDQVEESERSEGLNNADWSWKSQGPEKTSGSPAEQEKFDARSLPGNATHSEKLSGSLDLSKFLFWSETIGRAYFKGYDVKYGTGFFTSFKKTGSEGSSMLEDVQASFFLAPLTVSKIQYVLDFYEDVRKVFRWSEWDRFLPSLSHEEERIGESNTDYLIGRNCDLLLSLVRKLVLTSGREVIPEPFPLKSFKLSVTDSNLYSNPNFYKKFLTKDEISVSVPKFSIDHPKLARLKYDLIRLFPVVPPSKRGTLSYVIWILLGSVRERRSNVNISNHKNYQRIFALIRDILGSEVRKCAMLVKNANDTYEAWVLKELLLKFNVVQYSKESDLSTLRNEFKRITEGKVYREYKVKIRPMPWFGGLRLPDVYGKHILHDESVIRRAFPDGSKQLKEPYSIGFLKEDKEECAKHQTATFNAALLSMPWKFRVTLSFGGNLSNFSENEILSVELCNLLKKHSDTSHKILKHRENPDGLTPDFIVRVYATVDPEKPIGTILLDTKFSKYATIYDDDVCQIPYLGYFEELKKYFSHERPWETVPTKMVILYPGDEPYGKKGFLPKLNTYYDKLNNIVAVPLSLGEDKFENLKRLARILQKYVDDIVHRYESRPGRIEKAFWKSDDGSNPINGKVS